MSRNCLQILERLTCPLNRLWPTEFCQGAPRATSGAHLTLRWKCSSEMVVALFPRFDLREASHWPQQIEAAFEGGMWEIDQDVLMLTSPGSRPRSTWLSRKDFSGTNGAPASSSRIRFSMEPKFR